MSKYLQFVIVAAYTVLLVGSFFVVIDVFGWLHKPLRDSVVWGLILAWLLFCFSAPYFLTGFFLLFMNIRKPVLEEEQKMLHCLEDLRQRAIDVKKYHLLIAEEAGMNASAMGHRTLILTRGLLAGLTHDEIRAVMAHELGHLTSRDCMAGMAYFLTDCLPACASLILRYARWALLKVVNFASTLGGLLGLAVLFFLFYRFHVLKYAGALLVYMALLYLFHKLFRFLWLLNSRYTEYRQDAFAQKLGLGHDLRIALGKIIDNHPQKVHFFYVLQSDHPIIHNRIRRLEKMEGLRQ